jgi:hypothetical protein
MLDDWGLPGMAYLVLQISAAPRRPGSKVRSEADEPSGDGQADVRLSKRCTLTRIAIRPTRARIQVHV